MANQYEARLTQLIKTPIPNKNHKVNQIPNPWSEKPITKYIKETKYNTTHDIYPEIPEPKGA